MSLLNCMNAKKPIFRRLRFVACCLLLPLTMWYAVGVALRNLCFRWGLKKGVVTPCPSIGIGNLAMGGTGKTPHSEFVLRQLLDRGRRVALLSRGYGRKTKGFVMAGEGAASAQQLGDEPAMLAHKLPAVTVAVCERRVEGVARLMALPEPPETIVLDDVMQHRYVRPTTMVLLTEYEHPYCDDHILPFGNLREFRSGARRADCVVVTKCPADLGDNEKERLRRRLHLRPGQRLFFSTVDYAAPLPLRFDGHDAPACCDAFARGQHVLLVTGIAHPSPLERYLAQQGCAVTHLHFADHHDFTPSDVAKIVAAYEQMPPENRRVVTTEKDAQRLKAHRELAELPLCYVPITVRFLGESLSDEPVFFK
ncbi:MAG: tetraacyldisaccharide 4'-kinase [Bacteroidales bacterium]|nr:tetraacyldisaccharide 4'-kinase [Bacteroidales bacterium]